jgi:glyoxylase-like metal-dependent hydrolase (beta-lactamase superfamily II)
MTSEKSRNYHFRLGTFECIVVDDGSFAYSHPAQIFFANVPEDDLPQLLREHNLPVPWEEYVSPYTGLFVNTGENRVLVDTGGGGFAPTNGKLFESLKAEGIKLEDIDTVILTHGHPDHIGSTIDDKGKPAFPNARYVMWKDEWEYWTKDPDLSSIHMPENLKQLILSFAKSNLPPLKNQLDLIDQEVDIVPGVCAISAPGHTVGHIAVLISSGAQRLLCISDAAVHQIHFEQLDWYAAVDINPKQSLASRRKLLEMASSENAMIYAAHFPYPGLGHVTQKGNIWQWKPV